MNTQNNQVQINRSSSSTSLTFGIQKQLQKIDFYKQVQTLMLYDQDSYQLIQIADDQFGNICLSIDQKFCINSKNVGSQQNATYCFTYDKYSCYTDYGPYCNLTNGLNCATMDGINYSNLSYCVSQDSKVCYSDQGLYCKSANLLNCNISRIVNTCETYDGINCFNYSNGYKKGWKFTFDGNIIFKGSIPTNKFGTYCYSRNGLNCQQVFIKLLQQDVSTCLSDNKFSCIQDQGTICNTLTGNNNCRILNSTQNCITLDFKNCLKGLWIRINPNSDFAGSSSFCYSQDGSTCKMTLGGQICQNSNSQSNYLCQFQNKNNLLSDQLISVMQCLSYDGVNCYNDQQINCLNQSQPDNPFCQYKQTENYCQTTNGIDCIFYGPGWYFTLNGQQISQVYPEYFQINGSYCFSQNGINCSQSYGPFCNSKDGTFCSNIDRINPINTTQCISLNNKTCFNDQGILCKPSSQITDGSCGIQNPNFCLSNDQGKTCIDFTSGWYYTQNNITVYLQAEPNGNKGAYCFSKDGINCLLLPDPTCKLRDKSKCLSTIQCVSQGDQYCYRDQGSLCNATSRLNQICSININQKRCFSKDALNCLQFQNLQNQNQLQSSIQTMNTAFQLSLNNQLDGYSQNYLWCFTMDQIFCYTNNGASLTQNGTYCQTYDGYSCYFDYGPTCVQQSLYMCTTSDLINLSPVTYCASNDNLTCIQDKGQYCSASLGQYCKFSFIQNSCVTSDGFTCYNFAQRWYFTRNQVNVFNGSLSSLQVGSYCYSFDGINCKQKWLNFTSKNISYCITANNQTCYQDIGVLCQSPSNINYCLIRNQTNSCETQDGITCTNYNWIRNLKTKSLCYSIDSKSCLTTNGGIYCNQNSDYLCSFKNGFPQILTICLSYNNKYCYNCTLNDYKQCFSSNDNQNYCETLDGINCIQLSSGWYYTYDGFYVAPLPSQVQNPQLNGIQGFYCLSDDSYKCYKTYGEQCNLTNYRNCWIDINLSLINVSQCISSDGIDCLHDFGQNCAPIKTKNPGGTCNLQIAQTTCLTSNGGQSCYNIYSGYFFTQDNINTYKSLLPNGKSGSYCYSYNGQTCYSDYGVGCSSDGFNCTSQDGINLIKASYCISYDNNFCFRDIGQLCNSTGDLANTCNIVNRTRNCETFDGFTCINKNSGWYVTFDLLTVGVNYQNGLIRSYCFSTDGQNCVIDYGPKCNLTTGYMCSSSDGISLVKSFQCITSNNQSCFQDYGLFCNYTGNYTWCNTLFTFSTCSSIDGANCYNFIQGWYYTLDNNQVSSSIIKSNIKGTYCYSYDGLMCYKDFGASCDPKTGFMCSTSDGINPQIISYCITDNFVSCKQDYGQFCNFSGSQLWCNIYSYSSSCLNMYGNNKCYNPLTRWSLTYDGQNINQLQTGILGKLATYCYSFDGKSCFQDFGNLCNIVSGLYCSTSNGANLQYGTYCITSNNLTCYQDQGAYCNNTNQINWCNILNNTNNCFTVDSLTCFNFFAQYCLTFDGVQCTTKQISNQKGTYCWSNDSNQCSSSGVPNCDPKNGQICSGSNTSFCITMDNTTCLQDTGYYCNNTYDYRSCNINYDITKFCATKDSYNCLNSSRPFRNASQQQLQRLSVRNYFFYALSSTLQQTNNVTNVGTCEPSCSNNKKYCCIQVYLQNQKSLSLIDNICMDKNVAQQSYNFEINGFQYVLNCIQQKVEDKKAQTLKYYNIGIIIISIITYLLQ